MRPGILALSVLGLSLPQLAMASLDDLVCDDTGRLQGQLTTVIGAERQGYGLRDPESMLEIWIVPETGDWTVVQNYANGTSCIMALGEHWQTGIREPG